jgi:AcrR family transcriptional regulator
MARRGDTLREHILQVAKEVFLEIGFERTSMDVVAARAETSKRSLYAHFESKENLYLAVIEFMRGHFLNRLKMPGDYSDKPVEALTLFCSKYLEILFYRGSIRMCRMSMAQAERFPEGAEQHFDVIFTEVHTRLSSYLKTTFDLSTKASTEAAQKLLAQLLYPRFVRALFGLEELATTLSQENAVPDFELKPIRKAVAGLLETLQQI